MNEKLEAAPKRGRVAAQEEAPDRTDRPVRKENVFVDEEDLVTDEQLGEGYSYARGAAAAGDDAVLFIREKDVKPEVEEEEEEYQTTSLDALLAAWWKYKRENKRKKKKRKVLEIYRDENYWNDGKCTDEEDFAYYES